MYWYSASLFIKIYIVGIEWENYVTSLILNVKQGAKKQNSNQYMKFKMTDIYYSIYFFKNTIFYKQELVQKFPFVCFIKKN